MFEENYEIISDYYSSPQTIINWSVGTARVLSSVSPSGEEFILYATVSTIKYNSVHRQTILHTQPLNNVKIFYGRIKYSTVRLQYFTLNKIIHSRTDATKLIEKIIQSI